MSRFLLDSNAVSSLIRQQASSPILKRIAAVGPDLVCTSILVAAEIRFGVAKKGSSRLEAEAERVLNSLAVLDFESPADRRYAVLRTDLERRGLPIGANDMLIAAQCLALDATMVTNNLREFQRVQGLRVEDWLAP